MGIKGGPRYTQSLLNCGEEGAIIQARNNPKGWQLELQPQSIFQRMAFSYPEAGGKLTSVTGCVVWCWQGDATPQAEAAGRWEEWNCVLSTTHKHCVHNYSSFFFGVCEEGLGREIGNLALSKRCGRVWRSCGSGVQSPGQLGVGFLFCLWIDSLLYNKWHSILEYWGALGILWCFFGKRSVITCNSLNFLLHHHTSFNSSKIKSFNF